MRRHKRKWSAVAVAALGVWLLGMVAYGTKVHSYGSPETHALTPQAIPQAIVIFTGGQDRLATGLRLLAEARAPLLFVSGVAAGVEIADLIAVARQTPERLSCCIVIGAQATNTIGNALETAAWLQKHNLTSILLVTSAYHMPRSVLAMSVLAPNVNVTPNTVFSGAFEKNRWYTSPSALALVLQEYNKFLFTALLLLPPWIATWF